MVTNVIVYNTNSDLEVGSPSQGAGSCVPSGGFGESPLPWLVWLLEAAHVPWLRTLPPPPKRISAASVYIVIPPLSEIDPLTTLYN